MSQSFLSSNHSERAPGYKEHWARHGCYFPIGVNRGVFKTGLAIAAQVADYVAGVATGISAQKSAQSVESS